MVPSIDRALVGHPAAWNRPTGWVLLTVACFLGTFAAYAVGVFHIAGGVVFIPGQAALVGRCAAGVVGFARGGAVPAWLLAVASLYGSRADHVFLGLSGRTLAARAGYFVRPDGLAFLGIEGIVLGSLGVVAGALARVGVDALGAATADG